MQPVEPAHDRKVRLRYRPRPIVDAAAADVQDSGLRRDRQVVGAVDHRFALSNPTLVSAPSKKTSPPGQLQSILPHGWAWRRATKSPAAGCFRHEHAGSGGRAAALLRLAAVTVGRTDTALGAFYRRLSARIGKAKAVTATARKIAVLFYNAVRHGMEYVDPGASYYETRYRTRVVNNLQRRAKAFGFVLQPMEPAPGVVVS
jgi:hypothetical protein